MHSLTSALDGSAMFILLLVSVVQPFICEMSICLDKEKNML
jgi:hypothetical protein